MAERFSIYAGEPLLRLLAQSPDNRSGRINDVAARFGAIVEDELRRLNLTEGEWCAIVDANNGTFMSDEFSWRHAWANVMEADEDMGVKWGIDREILARRMRGLSMAGQAAIAEVIERYWSLDHKAHTTHREALLAAGARLP